MRLVLALLYFAKRSVRQNSLFGYVTNFCQVYSDTDSRKLLIAAFISPSELDLLHCKQWLVSPRCTRRCESQLPIEGIQEHYASGKARGPLSAVLITG